MSSIHSGHSDVRRSLTSVAVVRQLRAVSSRIMQVVHSGDPPVRAAAELTRPRTLAYQQKSIRRFLVLLPASAF